MLNEIIARRRADLDEQRRETPPETMQARAADAPPTRGFIKALRAAHSQGRPAVIAEMKRASPSKGLLREAYDPVAIAEDYAGHGASCLSVLTEARFFQGSAEHLQRVRAAVDLPLLRKDFLFDPYQLYEARWLGADAVLLIVAALADQSLRSLAELAAELDLDVLVEVHDERELARALALDCPLIGINNRDLHTFEVDLNTSIRLNQQLPAGHLAVCESGIGSADDYRKLSEHGLNTFLIGERLMRAESPGEALAEVFGFG